MVWAGHASLPAIHPTPLTPLAFSSNKYHKQDFHLGYCTLLNFSFSNFKILANNTDCDSDKESNQILHHEQPLVTQQNS
jgi:hypothetical protein